MAASLARVDVAHPTDRHRADARAGTGVREDMRWSDDV